MNEKNGLLIAFEGIDGTGKSTQLTHLGKHLEEKGCQVVMTFEPSDGPYGKQIRELFVNRKNVSPEEELELFIQDRRQHVNEVIEPALAAGKIVLTDRYYFSTVAYQGAAGCDPETIFAKNNFAPEPDMVVLLTIEAKQSLERIRQLRGETPNDFEQEEQLTQVAALFSSFTHPFIKRVDASKSFDDVQASIRNETDLLLQKKEHPCIRG